MGRECVLDARDMEPPEPLVRALKMAQSLEGGDYLRLRHRREPFLLYDNLEQGDYEYLTCSGVDVAFEVFIWRKGDAEALAAVQQQADKLAPADKSGA